MNSETQRAPSPLVGSTKSANRSRVYESDPEVAKAGVGNSQSQRRRQSQPFRLLSWVGPGGWGCQGFATPRKTGAPLTTPPARPKQTEIGGMAGIEFRGRIKKNQISA